jgi:hypothetical protein
MKKTKENEGVGYVGNAKGPEVGPLLERERWERLASRIMELGPYELATLAARICPELCLKNPVEAIGRAQRLLAAVSIEDSVSSDRVVAEMKDRENRKLATRRVDFQSGVRKITGVEKRGTGRYSALYWFERFLKGKDGRKWKVWLETYRRNEFTELELRKLLEEFEDWRWPRKKGTQGRRRSKYDRRVVVRDDQGVAWVRAPTKQLVLTKTDKAAVHKAAVKHGWKEKLGSNFAKREPIRQDQPGWGEHHKKEKGKQLPGIRRPPLKAGKLG